MTAVALSPATAGYTLSNGVLNRDPSGGLLNSAILRVLTPLGSYWADPSLGSRLHELQRQKDLMRVGQLAKQYIEQALQGMIDDGRLDAVNVSIHQAHDSRLLLAIELVSVTGQRWSFNHFISVMA